MILLNGVAGDSVELEICGSWYSEFKIQSSDGRSHYYVDLHGTDHQYCTCDAFGFSKDIPKICKHIRSIRNTGCFWSETDDSLYDRIEVLEKPSKYLLTTDPERKCPRCGGPTTRTTFTPRLAEVYPK